MFTKPKFTLNLYKLIKFIEAPMRVLFQNYPISTDNLLQCHHVQQSSAEREETDISQV